MKCSRLVGVGKLIDWQGSGESRAYVVRYQAEDIINWQTQRINGRNVVTMIALREKVESPDDADPFVSKQTEVVRVLKLETKPTKPLGMLLKSGKKTRGVRMLVGQKLKLVSHFVLENRCL